MGIWSVVRGGRGMGDVYLTCLELCAGSREDVNR
jgi:hypothetical protein